jgi:GAF domain-containing protein
VRRRASSADDEQGIAPVADHRQARRLQRRSRQLALANALGARLAVLTDPVEICAAAVEEINRALGCYVCTLVALGEDDVVRTVAGHGAPGERLAAQRWHQPRAAGVIGRCLGERRVVLVNDVGLEAAYSLTPETAGTRAELCAPLWVGDRLWGAINLEEDRADAFDAEDAALLQTVSDQVGLALRLAETLAALDAARSRPPGDGPATARGPALALRRVRSEDGR